MRRVIHACCALTTLAMLLAMPAVAQTGNEADTTTTDSTLVGYHDDGTPGGPTSIPRQLLVDNPDPYFYRIPVRVFKPWYEWKGRFAERTGLKFGINYAFTYLAASERATPTADKNALGGIFDIQGTWQAVGKASGNIGLLGFKVEDRHATMVSPMFLGFQTGSGLLTATKFNDFNFRLQELWWQQQLWDNRVSALGGKVDVTNYYNFFTMINPFMNFFSYAFSVSPTANWPNQGAGVLAAVMPTSAKNFYVMAGVHDASGDPLNNNEFFYFGDNLFDGKLFTVLEGGYFPSYDDRYTRRVSVTLWHADAYTGSEEGQGAAMAASWFVKDKYLPFLLAGHSDGKGANVLAKNSVSLGLGRRFFTHDVMGVGVNWIEPPGGLRDQYLSEVYYRFYFTQQLAVTPSVQYVVNPSFNTGVRSMWYVGVRTRLTF